MTASSSTRFSGGFFSRALRGLISIWSLNPSPSIKEKMGHLKEMICLGCDKSAPNCLLTVSPALRGASRGRARCGSGMVSVVWVKRR